MSLDSVDILFTSTVKFDISFITWRGFILFVVAPENPVEDPAQYSRTFRTIHE